MDNPNRNFYKTLGIWRNANNNEVREAYMRLRKIHHPLFHPRDERAAERFRQISEAYEVLSDPEKRRAYNLYLLGQGTLDDVITNPAQIIDDWQPTKRDIFKFFERSNAGVTISLATGIALTGVALTYIYGLDITPFNRIIPQHSMEAYREMARRGYDLSGTSAFFGALFISLGIGGLVALTYSYGKTAIDLRNFYKRKKNAITFDTTKKKK